MGLNNQAKRNVRAIAGMLALVLFLTGLSFAQRIDGTLRGTVLDPSGAVVPDAKVTATNLANGVSQSTTTTSSGDFTFPNLLSGKYDVTVEKAGFQKYVGKDIDVRANQVTDAVANMTVGAEGTTVEVVGGAETVQTTDSTLTNTFDANQIVNLPIPQVAGSNGIFNLAILAPNTTTQAGGVLGQGGSIGGARPRMNNFSVDGLDDNRVDITGPQSNVVADAVAEFDLLTNQFSAEYGHSAGGQFNIVTKSGTNNWHGTVFGVNSNRNYNAFDNIEKQAQGCDVDPDCEKARFDYNTLGASIGGPLIKDRVFIFGAYQRIFAGFQGSSSVIEAPTAAGKANLLSLAANPAVTEILNQFPTSGGATRTIAVTGAGGATLPVEVGELALLAPSFFNEHDYHVNGDVNFGRHQVRMRYLNNRQRQPNLSDPPIATFSGDVAYDVHKATITDAWTITDRFINDLRLGYTRQINSFTVPPEFSNFPNVFVTELSSFQVGPEGNSPQSGGQNVYQLLDQMTYATGGHTLKWGAEYRRWIAPSGFLPRARGEWVYSTLTNLVTDTVPIDFAKRGAGSGLFDGNQTATFAFFQDDWKVTPRLTLNLGIRYEWFGVPNGARLQTLNSLATLPGTILEFNEPKSDTNNWAPRLGFAWDVTGDGKTALRGGFGMSYDVIPQNFPTLQLPPQLQSEQDPDITCGLPSRPSWCAGYDPSALARGELTGQGFLQNGGLLQVNLPPTNQAEARAATQGIIFDQQMPIVYTWTLSLQRELFKNTSLELRYLGTRGTGMLVQTQINSRSAFDNGASPLPTFLDPAEVPTTFASAPCPAVAPLTPVPCQATLNDFSTVAGVRPFESAGFLGAVTGFPYTGESIYHSGSADFTHRLTEGGWGSLFLRANYTWAHNIDNATNELFSSLINPRRPEDGNHIERERGRSVLDIRHKGAVSFTYELPGSKLENTFARLLVGGWQVNGTYLIQSGQPANARSALDTNGNGDAAGDRAIFNPAGDPNRGTDVDTVCWNGVTTSVGCADPTLIVGYVALDPTAGFVLAAPGTLTTSGRNTLTTPGRNNLDMSVFKNLKFTESTSLQFRVEAFNLLNHRQFSFANPGVFPIVGIDDSAINASAFVDVASPLFRDVKQLNGGSRNLQLGVKFIF